jgi:hypothetical protein
MSIRIFREALARFKETEQPEAVLLVAGDRDYVSILAAWLRCDVRPRRRITRIGGRTDAETWQWLWENTCFSKDALRDASGVPTKRFEAKLDALIANRVIYPDGNINSFVKRYLRERVLRLLGVDASTRRALRVPAVAAADSDS